MNSYPNARLTQKGRLRLVTQHLEHGRSFTEGFLNKARLLAAQWISAVSGAKMCENGPI